MCLGAAMKTGDSVGDSEKIEAIKHASLLVRRVHNAQEMRHRHDVNKILSLRPRQRHHSDTVH
jgi:hypothetical protein